MFSSERCCKEVGQTPWSGWLNQSPKESKLRCRGSRSVINSHDGLIEGATELQNLGVGDARPTNLLNQRSPHGQSEGSNHRNTSAWCVRCRWRENMTVETNGSPNVLVVRLRISWPPSLSGRDEGQNIPSRWHLEYASAWAHKFSHQNPAGST